MDEKVHEKLTNTSVNIESCHPERSEEEIDSIRQKTEENSSDKS